MFLFFLIFLFDEEEEDFSIIGGKRHKTKDGYIEHHYVDAVITTKDYISDGKYQVMSSIVLSAIIVTSAMVLIMIFLICSKRHEIKNSRNSVKQRQK